MSHWWTQKGGSRPFGCGCATCDTFILLSTFNGSPATLLREVCSNREVKPPTCDVMFFFYVETWWVANSLANWSASTEVAKSAKGRMRPQSAPALRSKSMGGPKLRSFFCFFMFFPGFDAWSLHMAAFPCLSKIPKHHIAG